MVLSIVHCNFLGHVQLHEECMQAEAAIATNLMSVLSCHLSISGDPRAVAANATQNITAFLARYRSFDTF